MPPMDGVTIKSFRGDTISYLTRRFDNGQINLSNFEYIIVHVGTNNIDRGDKYSNMIADYGNLIMEVIIKITMRLDPWLVAILPLS